MNKVFTFTLWGILVLAMVGVAIGAFLLPHRQTARDTAPGLVIGGGDSLARAGVTRAQFPAAQFSLTDQQGQQLATADLHGGPWIADFIFTRCGGSCPIMSHKMAELQKQTPANVKLVSFTVDPEHDTAEVLKTYAEALGANPGRWHFLTGTSGQMSEAAYGMKISVRPATENKVEGILHSNRFLLVNAEGNVVGIYDSTSDEAMKQLVADASRLAAGRSL